MTQSTLRRIVAAMIAALSVLGITIVATSTQGPEQAPSVTITVKGPGHSTATVTAPQSVVKQAADDLHAGLRTETPAGVPSAELDAGREQQEALAADDQLPIVTPLAAPSQRGCVSRFVQNYSTRRGVTPRLFVLHYTVSPNRPGWDDVNAIVSLFNRPAFAASSSYVIDREAHCAYIVRESDKPWTQAAFNPVSISVEIINSGRERNLIDGPGRAKLVQVMADSMRRWKIPARQGAIAGATVIRSGIVDHVTLGAGGGGHNDVNPYRAEIPGLIADVKREMAKGTITSTDRVTCRKLNSWRNAGRPRGGQWERNSVRRKRALTSRGVVCTARGPVLTAA